MPILRPVQRNVPNPYGNYLGHPFSVGSSGSNAMTVPAPPTQQASQGSLVMGHQSPAQLLMIKVRSVLTQAEIDMFQDMTAKVTALMTPDEMQEMTAITAAQLTNAVDLTDDDLLQQVRDAEMDMESVAMPPEGIQPGYNCLDPDMATTIVVNWLDHGDETIEDLNALNNPADPTYEQRKNFEITGGGVDYALMVDKELTMTKSNRLRPKIAIERLYVGDGGAMSSVNAMLAGCTLQEPDCYRITDGLVEVVVTHDMIDAHRHPPTLTQQALAGPIAQITGKWNAHTKSLLGYRRSDEAYDPIAPPAQELSGPSYDDILNERDKRLHDERKVREGQIELNTAARTATRFTSKGTKLIIAFPKPRANPLTGVPDPAPRALLLQEAVKGMNQVQDETLDDMAANHGTVGVTLELTEFDPTLVPPGTDRWEIPSATITAEAGPLLPAAPVAADPSMTAIYTPAVDLGVIGFEDMINEAYRTLDFTWSNCHPQDSAFSCLIMKAIEGAEEQVRMSPLNAPDAATSLGLVLVPIHATLAVSVHLPGPVKAPMSPGQLAQSIPGSTVTAGGISGTSITANANVSVQWQQVNAWSNQGGLQGVGQYLNVQAPTFNQLTDEDGDEIPSIRIRHLKPNNEYRALDGSVIEVDATGNYVIHDDQARITYRAARVRDFNRFVNGSDLVAEFIEDLGKLGASQEQASCSSIEMFIRWLVHQAAKHDNEAPPEDVPPVSVDKGDAQAGPIVLDAERAELVNA